MAITVDPFIDRAMIQRITELWTTKGVVTERQMCGLLRKDPNAPIVQIKRVRAIMRYLNFTKRPAQ